MTSRPKRSCGVSQEAPHDRQFVASRVGTEVSRRRSWIADVALSALYLFFALGLGALSVEAPHVTPLWSILLLGAGGVAILMLRRRFATPAFAGAIVLTLLSLAGGTGAESVIVVGALYLAGVTRSARFAWASFAIAMVLGAVGALILAVRFRVGPSLWGITIPSNYRDSFVDWANCYAIIAVITLISTLLGAYVGQRRRYVESLVLRAEQMERERDQQSEIAGARERERIAREMHDVIAHSLAVMIAMADGAQAAATQRPAETREAIARVADTGRRTLDEVRRLLGTVRGEDELSLTEYMPQPDASQLNVLVSEFTAAGLPVRMESTGPPTADAALGLTVYRIVQESLTNVLRHGRGVRDVTVLTTWLAEEVTILVEDASAPARVPSIGGRGLLGIRERAALYHGAVEVGPRDGGGWRVFVRLPCAVSWR